MPNVSNEKLVALNLERLKYWLGKGAHVTPPVGELLGEITINIIKYIIYRRFLCSNNLGKTLIVPVIHQSNIQKTQ